VTWECPAPRTVASSTTSKLAIRMAPLGLGARRRRPLWSASSNGGCGLDVHKKSVAACVRVPGAHGRGLQEVRARLIPKRSTPPSQTWRTFLTNHVQELVSIDFFTVPTAQLRVLFVLVVLAHHRRRVLHFNVTEHPTAAWTAQQIVDFPGRHPPRPTSCVTETPSTVTPSVNV
jgi:hypothetical protein